MGDYADDAIDRDLAMASLDDDSLDGQVIRQRRKPQQSERLRKAIEEAERRSRGESHD